MSDILADIHAPMDVSSDANFIWSIANKLRGTFMPDKYGDVIIPMTILRRFECTLEPTKSKVITQFLTQADTPALALEKISGQQFYCTSRFTLRELCNDPDHLPENFTAYLQGFSANAKEIFELLSLPKQIDEMQKGGCLFSVVSAFADLDLYPEHCDSIRMGYIFENLIGRFFQNVDAGQYYTGRDIIAALVSILISEGCSDLMDDHKVVTVLDQACGTGGMLSIAYTYLKALNPTIDVRLFGQELMGVSYAVGLAEMLIKGQDAKQFRHADTLQEDCFPTTKMRFVLENPPFGTAWAGKDAKDGQEDRVREEHARGTSSRWGHGLPTGGDAQLLFMQSAIHKMDPLCGRAAIISNGSPLFTGGTSSGESQIRRWMLENDLIEAIIALPTDLFYNTGIQTFVWVLSHNKRPERRGKVQLIDAAHISHKLRKPLGNKKVEFTPEDQHAITDLYNAFTPGEHVKIFDNEDFLYREYAVYQPLQRSYAITPERIETMLQKGSLDALYDPAWVYEFVHSEGKPTPKDEKKNDLFLKNKPFYDSILARLRDATSDTVYRRKADFERVLRDLLPDLEKKLLTKLLEGLSQMDKTAERQTDRHGNPLMDKETKDSEIVPFKQSIEDYMAREVLPYLPDAQAFFEEDLASTPPKYKVGAEIPFTRYFYQYQPPTPSETLAQQFLAIESSIHQRVATLFEETAR